VEEKRFAATWIQEDWYPLLSWGAFGGFRGFLAEPGTYTVKLSADGKEFVQTLEVRKDPRSEGSLKDIQEQIQMQMDIREDLNTVSDMISQIEWMRKQCDDLEDVLKEGKGSDDLLKNIHDFDKKLRSIEDELFQPIIAEGDTKSFRYPQKLYFKLSVLAGDVANSVDFAPNQQQKEVHALLKEHMMVQKRQFDRLLETELPAFNSLLKEKNIARIIVPPVK